MVTEMKPSRSSRGWWAIYTKHQHEKVIAGILKTRGCDVFLPTYEVRRQWKDRVVSLDHPLFPGYLFVREEIDLRLQVLTTPGVHMVVSQGTHFALVPCSEIDAIRRALDTRSRVEPHPYLQFGETVRVIRGAMTGMIGICVRQKNACRLILSVEMLAKSVAVEVNAADVVPAGKNALSGAHQEIRLDMPTVSPLASRYASPRCP
jgi:transcription antitermination factor NusG